MRHLETFKSKEIYENFTADPLAYNSSLQVAEPHNIPLPLKQKKDDQERVKRAFAPLTIILIMICIGVYFYGNYVIPKIREREKQGYFPYISLFESRLLYDEIPSLRLGEELNSKYGVKLKKDLLNLSPEGLEVLEKMNQEPIWKGLYPVFLNWKERDIFFKAPLFECILKGELYRLITPTFLHTNLIHLLLNMLWLSLLGKELEIKIGRLKMTYLILIGAIVTNTLQYLISGALFMGFSGGITVMAGYVWVRKKDAPGEFYEIERSSLIFLWIFIFGLFALQMIAFFLGIFHITSISLPIANTAHVSGAFLGMCLAKINFFYRRA